MNGNIDWQVLADDIDNARFARSARWAGAFVAALILASVASAIFTLASVI